MAGAKKPELLCPVGSRDALVAAVQNGADAVYFGVGRFNARAFAQELDVRDAIAYAHERAVAVHLTFNTLLTDRELPEVLDRIGEVYTMGADALILQDVGLTRLVRQNFPDLPVHASTQLSVTDAQGCDACATMGFDRVVLARECSLANLIAIRAATDMPLEVFVHGAMCASVSGQCLLSSLIGGRSANRGGCAQPCRQPYALPAQSGYLLNMKDLNMLFHVRALFEAGVCSFKIEGRMKRPEYVALAAAAYRFAIDTMYQPPEQTAAQLQRHNDALLGSFNRGGFGTGCTVSRDALVYPGRQGHCGVAVGQSVRGGVRLTAPVAKGDVLAYRVDGEAQDRTQQMAQSYPIGLASILPDAQGVVYKTQDAQLLHRAQQQSAGEQKQLPLRFAVRITAQAATLTVQWGEKTVTVTHEGGSVAQNAPLTPQKVEDALRKLGGTPYVLQELTVQLDEGLFVSAKALNALRRDALQALFQSTRPAVQIDISPLQTIASLPAAPQLLAQCDTIAQAQVCDASCAHAIYAQIRVFNDHAVQAWRDFAQRAQKPVYLCLPPVLMQEDLTRCLPKLTGFAGAVAGNIGQIAPLARLYEQVIADYTLNVTNSHAAQQLLRMGGTQITLSAECTCAQAKQIARTCPAQLIVYGYTPAMHLSSCPIRQAGGGKCGANCQDGTLLHDRLGYDFTLLPMNWSQKAGGCFVQLLNAHPTDGLKVFKKLPQNAHWRLCFAAHSPEQTAQVLAQYDNALRGLPYAPAPNATAGHFSKGWQ